MHDRKQIIRLKIVGIGQCESDDKRTAYQRLSWYPVLLVPNLSNLSNLYIAV